MQIDIEDSKRPIRIIQITDTHLGEEENSTLLDMNTDSSFDHVLKMLQERPQQADLLVVTGDIADHGARPAYERFQSKMARFEQPKLWLGGNHDVASRMREIVGFGLELTRRVFIGEWQIIMLDSVTPGKVGGYLQRSELQFLRHCLADKPDAPTLIFFHHHPIPIGCDWLDEQQIENSEEFLGVIRQFSSVKAVCWGHVHQNFDQIQGGVRYMSAPSTCVQFAPCSANFKVDDIAPGVRWLELHADGRIDTETWRVRGVDFKVDLASTGYEQ